MGFYYRVKRGENLFFLSEKFSVPLISLINFNNLKKEVEGGEILYIEKLPNRTYKVGIGENYKSVSKKFSVSEESLKKINGLEYLFYGVTIYIP